MGPRRRANLKGTWTVAAPPPRDEAAGRGSIVIVSSTAGQRGEAFYSNYAASKAPDQLHQSLATELAPIIRVN